VRAFSITDEKIEPKNSKFFCPNHTLRRSVENKKKEGRSAVRGTFFFGV
jgi:hypothetical protein